MNKSGKKLLLLCLLPLLLFSVQGLVIHLKLNFLDSQKIVPVLIKKECDKRYCNYDYSIVRKGDYLMLGHILRSHTLWDTDGVELFPISGSRGQRSDSWVNLYVYKISVKNETVVLKAKHPKISKLGIFAGVYPRFSNSKDIVSVSDISPVMSITSQILSLILLLFFISAAFVSNNKEGTKLADSRNFLLLVSILALINVGFNSHFFDSLFYTAKTRVDLLRFFAVLGLLTPGISCIKNTSLRKIMVFAVAIAIAGSPFFLRTISIAGWSYYSCTVTCAALFSLTSCIFSRTFLFSTLISLFLLYDAFRVMGFPLPDHPPIYFSQIALTTFALGLSWKQGAGTIIPFAKRAYDNIIRDLGLISLSESAKNVGDKFNEIDAEALLRKVPDIAAANNVSIVFLLPNAPATTFSYSKKEDKFKFYDDGKVQGLIFTRVLLYSEPYWFKTIEELRSDNFEKLKPNLNHASSKYMCALPLFHKEKVIGVMSLTGFNDKALEGKSGLITREELKQKMKMVTREFENIMGTQMLDGVRTSQERAKGLEYIIRGLILDCDSNSDFIDEICKQFAKAAGRRLIIYKRVENKGHIVAHTDLGDQEENWKKMPLNLDPKSGNKVGPAIVAFNEGKSSYVREVREIFEQMHPRTRELWDDMQAEETITIPFKMVDNEYIFLFISERGKVEPDSYWLTAVESVRPFINSAALLVEQKSSLTALGRMSARLIGDEQIREEVLRQAIAGEIPTVVGRKVSSLLLFIDLEGSTDLEDDCEKKANTYAAFYDRLNKVCQDQLSAVIRKTMGDGLIISVPPEGSERPNLANRLAILAEEAEHIGIDVGGKGTRVVVHFGEYFLGLLGTNTFGSPDLAGKEIDRLCKLEGVTKDWSRKTRAKVAITVEGFGYIFKGVELEPSGYADKIGSYYIYGDGKDLLDPSNRKTKKNLG